MSDTSNLYPIQNEDSKNNKSQADLYGIEGNDDNNDQSPFKQLVAQIQKEYDIAYKAQSSRIQVNLRRLKLYNNQKRDPDTVGNNMLFEIMQSVLSSLYVDQMASSFIGRTIEGQDKSEALNNTAKFDYDEMQKATTDYFWDWDTCFFGSGLLGMTEFDRDMMIPIPDLWDPTVTLHDVDAYAVNGIGRKKEGQARYFGREILQRRVEMEDIPSVFGLKELKLTRPTRSMYEQGRQSREDAQGLNNQLRYDEKELGVNARYPLVEWYTWWKHKDLTDDEPKRIIVWLGNDLKKVCRFKILKNQKRWPVIHRKLFPLSHFWDSVSIPDLIEDKQRMQAVLSNLGVKMLKSSLYGMYIYNKSKIKNKGDLNWDLDKMVPVELKANESINDVVVPMPKSEANLAVFNYIMGMIDMEGQKATGTPEMNMGVPGNKGKGNKTLGELNKVDAKSANRYSLVSKIWGWSEQEFWEHWYENYKEHFKSRIDEKMVRINTVFGYQYKFESRKDLISDIDPDVFITSKFQSDQERNNERALTMQYGQLLGSTPGANMRYFLKKTGRLHNIESDELDRLLPPTPDEQKARYENVSLEKDDFVPVSPNDNDDEHLIEHARAKETPAMLAHIATHQHARELKKSNPNLFPGMNQQGGQPQQGQIQGNQGIGDKFQQLGKSKVNKPQMTVGGSGMKPQ